MSAGRSEGARSPSGDASAKGAMSAVLPMAPAQMAHSEGVWRTAWRRFRTIASAWCRC